MSSQFFFGFAHHAIVTSLRFEAGFVGLHGEINAYNLPFAAILVGLNTLGSQVSIKKKKKEKLLSLVLGSIL